MNCPSALDCFLSCLGWHSAAALYYQKAQSHVFVNHDQTLSVFQETHRGIQGLTATAAQEQGVFAPEDCAYIRLLGYAIVYRE